MVIDPHEELRRALDARTYEDGLADGAFQELAHLHMHLMDLTRAVAQAVGDVEDRMSRLRGRP